MPPSPWIGSTRNAAVLGVIALTSASASPNGMILNPGVAGPKNSLYCGVDEKLTIVVVRPWKLPEQTMISAWSLAMPFLR